jgi:hypothetical protein
LNPIRKILVLALVLLFTIPVLPGSTTADGSRAIVFEDDFEHGVGEWAHGGAEDEWEIGMPTDGPGSCHAESSNCWGTDLDDSYSNGTNSWLRSPGIDLTNYQSATLNYWQWYEIQFFIFWGDVGYLEISTDDGWTWTSLTNFTSSSANHDWEEIEIDISDYVGGTVYFRFRLWSNDFWVESGWFIDDFKITGGSSSGVHDLLHGEIKLSPDPGNVGEVVTFKADIKNNGDFTETEVPVKTTITFSGNDKTVFENTEYIDKIDPGKVIWVSFEWKPESPGTYIVMSEAVLDGDAKPDDNIQRRRFQVKGKTHDIAVNKIKIDPVNPDVGASTTFYVTVENKGNKAEKEILVTLKIFDSSDNLVHEDEEIIDYLESGANVPITFLWTPTSAGQYIAYAECYHSLDEIPKNNEKSVEFYVAYEFHDMAVTSAWTEPEDGAPGFERKVVARVENKGTETESGFKLRIKISDPSDTLVLDESTTMPALNPKSSTDTGWGFKPESSGIYTVKFKVNLSGDQDPSNDVLIHNFLVPNVVRDVGVDAMSVIPRSDDIDVKRSIGIIVKNYGDLEESFSTSLEIKDPSGVKVHEQSFQSTLEPGAKNSLQSDFIPATLGVYTVTARTMLDIDQVPENDEAVTTLIATSHEYHDLGIESLKVFPRTAGLIERNITVVVDNVGTEHEEGITVSLEIMRGNQTSMTAVETAIALDPGKTWQKVWKYTPSAEGNYSAKVTVLHPDDEFVENNVTSVAFHAFENLSNDVGVEDIVIEPRTGDKETRTITVIGGNHGMLGQTVVVNVTVSGPTGSSEIYSGNTSLDFGMTAEVAMVEFLPTVYGNYNVTAVVKTPDGDPFPANDVMTVDFWCVPILYHDVGVEGLVVDPRTEGPDVQRTIVASVANYGDVNESVGISINIIRNNVTIFSDQTTKPVTTLIEYSWSYTPTEIGEYTVKVWTELDGDQVPENNALETTFLSTKSGLDHDLAIGSVNAKPEIVPVGEQTHIEVQVWNLGTVTEEFSVVLYQDGQTGKVEVGREALTVEPQRSGTVKFKFRPTTVGVHVLGVEAELAIDQDKSNNNKNVTVEAVTALPVDIEVKSISMVDRKLINTVVNARATISNKGNTKVSGIKVTITASGEGGFRHVKNATINLEPGTSQEVTFPFTPTTIGTYTVTIEINAAGDQNPANDKRVANLYIFGEDSVTNPKTRLDSGIPLWVVIIVLIVILALGYHYYETQREKRRGGSRPPGREQRQAEGPGREHAEARVHRRREAGKRRRDRGYR